MKRRELFQQTLGVALFAARALRGQPPTFNGPAGGSRGTQLVTLLAGPFDTSSGPGGIRRLIDVPQFATYVRIQVNPGEEGKIAIGNSAMAAAQGNIADSAFVELWPNWDGNTDNGRSDAWIVSDPKWRNTIDLSQIYVWPEIAGERPLVTAYQLV
jgi:hypothetical protein